jgi:DNA helicase HerA-like ATPase
MPTQHTPVAIRTVPEPIRGQPAFVGTIVGESTTREFRLALAHESVREQDIVAVDAELQPGQEGNGREGRWRVWAKVQRIERLNPLFPSEAGHELAATGTDPLDTVISLSREMVTAVCQVLGAEPITGAEGGKLRQLRYPARPASSTYRPLEDDLNRVIMGQLRDREHRALHLASLANRPEVSVRVDGHTVVTRHLAILAMTGAGKSWAARRLVEEIAAKNFPIVIFDPHGDYTGLADVPELQGRVSRYYAHFPVFDEDADTVMSIVNTLGYELTPKMQVLFGAVFSAAKTCYDVEARERQEAAEWLAGQVGRPQIAEFGIRPDFYLVADIAQVAAAAIRAQDQPTLQRLAGLGWQDVLGYTGTDASTLTGIVSRTRKAAAAMRRMEETNRRVARDAEPLPQNRTELVRRGHISIVSLAGYTSDFQATLYTIVAEEIFDARMRNELRWPVLLVLEEAHNFVPGKAETPAEQRSIATTKQIAQEGRKFGVGLVLISQRPSRLDETTLSQCNSYIILRMVNPSDQNFVRRVVESLTEDEARMLPALDVGEAILSGQFVNFPVLARITPPASQGEREEADAFAALDAIEDEPAERAPRRPR